MREQYPTEEELQKIRDWDIMDPRGLIEFIQEIWWAADWGISIKRGRTFWDQAWVMRVNMSTGGWSGNEDIITAFRENLIWTFHWTVHRVGGHYTFEIPVKEWKGDRK